MNYHYQAMYYLDNYWRLPSEHEWHESNELLFVRFVLFLFVNIVGGCIK